MPTRDRRLDRAIAMLDRMSSYSAAEIKLARVTAGLSQEDVGRAVGLSASQVGRFERRELDDIRLDQLCRLSAAVGLVPAFRLYPGGDPVRDTAQTRLLERLHQRISPALRWRTEVPLHGRDDLRAWDAVIDGSGCVDAVEAESRLGDIQATERRSMLKLRDDGIIVHLMLLVADTRADRRALALGRESLRGQFPLDTRAALASLTMGRCPGANAVIVL